MAFSFYSFCRNWIVCRVFLPGDSLLFVAGIYSNELASELFQFDNDLINLALIAILVILSGVLGNMVGYWFGAASGPFLFSRKDTFFFKKKHLFAAKEFYDKHGGGAIVFARFLPIIRTFAPIIAGIVRMERHKFTLYNVIGSISWAVSMLFAGHYLYKFFLNQFGFDLKDRLEFIVLGIILVTTAPVIIRLLRKPKK